MLSDSYGTSVPFPTFLGTTMTSIDDVGPDRVVISGGPFDSAMSSGRFGPRTGPYGIRKGSRALGELLLYSGSRGLIDIDTGERYESVLKDTLVDIGDFVVYPTDIMKTTQNLASGIYDIVKRGAFSIFMGGDHYVSYPSVLGFAKAMEYLNPGVRIGYIHIDGHLDFANDDPVMGRFFYGSQARRISELPQIVNSSMVWIGATGTASREQVDAIIRNGGMIYFAKDVHQLGASNIAALAGDHALNGCDLIYITLDVDVIDAGYLPGTGAVDNNAITPSQIKEILSGLMRYPIGAMDVMEVSPRLDPSGRSISIAAEMAFTAARSRVLRPLP